MLGSNGSGKSTLLRIMAGVDKDFFGDAKPADGIRIGYLPQEPQLDASKTVRGNVEEAVASTKKLLRRFDEMNAKLGEEMSAAAMDKLLEEQGKLQDAIEAANGWDLDRTLEIAMDALRLPPREAAVDKLSGGERRRVALCHVLLERPGHAAARRADQPPRRRERRLARAPPARVPGDGRGRHPRSLLPRQRRRLDPRARPRRRDPLGGELLVVARAEAEAARSEEKTESARQRTLARELEWVRASPRARQAKSKARLAAYDELLAEEQQKREDTIVIAIPPGPHLGDVVVEAEHLRKAYGDNVLIEDLNFSLPRGGIVGVIGANGAGKTTLFRMIVGQEKPDGGTLRIGETVKLAYVDQSRDSLDGDKTAFQEIARGPSSWRSASARSRPAPTSPRSTSRGPTRRRRSRTSRAASATVSTWPSCCARAATSSCSTSRPTTSTSTCCGRSRTRCSTSPGCAVVISHDRWFLDRIATHILAFEGDSQVVWFEGNYQDYEAERKRRLGSAADQPHRIRYKKLIH